MYERYERIVKSLRFCMRLEEPAFECIEMDGGCCDSIGRCIPHLMDEAADVIEELIKAKDKLSEKVAHWEAEVVKSDCDAWLAENAEAMRWIPVAKRLPECEQEVMICTEMKLVGKDAYIDSIVTPAIYEDGTMPECDSIWHWEDIDYAGWDEENDCGIIPEGWWENRHFNPDEVYNNPVDGKVVAWMPLPDPYKPKEET